MTCVLSFNMRPWEPFWLPKTTSTPFPPMFKLIDEDKENTKKKSETVAKTPATGKLQSGKRRHSSSMPLNLVVNPSSSRYHDSDSSPPPMKVPRIDGATDSVNARKMVCNCCESEPNICKNNVAIKNKYDRKHGKLNPSGSGAKCDKTNGKYADFDDYVEYFRQCAADDDNTVVPCKRPAMRRCPEPGWDQRLIERIHNFRALKHLQHGVIDFRRQYKNGFRYRSRQRAPLRVQLMRYRCMTSLCDKLRHLP